MKIIVSIFVLFINTQSLAQIDTIKDGNAVYFFGPSTAELDTLNENYLDAIDDFYYYTNRIVQYLKQNNIKLEYLAARNITIKFDSDSSITINRDSINFGTILTNGKNKPIILKYVLTDDKLKEKIKAYFNLK